MLLDLRFVSSVVLADVDSLAPFGLAVSHGDILAVTLVAGNLVAPAGLVLCRLCGHFIPPLIPQEVLLELVS